MLQFTIDLDYKGCPLCTKKKPTKRAKRFFGERPVQLVLTLFVKMRTELWKKAKSASKSQWPLSDIRCRMIRLKKHVISLKKKITNVLTILTKGFKHD